MNIVKHCANVGWDFIEHKPEKIEEILIIKGSPLLLDI